LEHFKTSKCGLDGRHDRPAQPPVSGNRQTNDEKKDVAIAQVSACSGGLLNKSESEKNTDGKKFG